MKKGEKKEGTSNEKMYRKEVGGRGSKKKEGRRKTR